jgi:hypothetical protein
LQESMEGDGWHQNGKLHLGVGIGNDFQGVGMAAGSISLRHEVG